MIPKYKANKINANVYKEILKKHVRNFGTAFN